MKQATYLPLQLLEYGKRGPDTFIFRVFRLDSEINVSGPFFPNSLPGGISKWEPPDPISNSEVKLLSADDSVGGPM